MQTIYLDVLLIFNLYMNFLLLRLTAGLTHTKLPFGRALLGAGLGSLSALLILAPPMPAVLSALLRLGLTVPICLAAFGRRRLVRHCMCFFGAGIVMAGLLLALALTTNVRVLHANTCWYIDISLLHLVLFTIAAYVLLGFVQRLHSRTQTAEGYRVTVRFRSCTAQLEGLADTGNVLTDFCTGLPVIVCDREKLGTMPQLAGKRLRPLPYETISGSGMLPVFRPDETVIRTDSGAVRPVDVLIGVGERKDGRAIFHPRLLQ